MSPDNPNAAHTRKAFWYLILNIGVLLIFLCIITFNISPGGFGALFMILPLALVLFSVMGVFHVINSFRKNEPNSAKKIIVLIGHSLFFMVSLGMVSFIVLDLFATH